VEIVDSRKCNLMNLKRVEVFLELPEKTLTTHYEELLEDDLFIAEVNKMIAFVKSEHGFDKGIFRMQSVPSARREVENPAMLEFVRRAAGADAAGDQQDVEQGRLREGPVGDHAEALRPAHRPRLLGEGEDPELPSERRGAAEDLPRSDEVQLLDVVEQDDAYRDHDMTPLAKNRTRYSEGVTPSPLTKAWRSESAEPSPVSSAKHRAKLRGPFKSQKVIGGTVTIPAKIAARTFGIVCKSLSE